MLAAILALGVVATTARAVAGAKAAREIAMQANASATCLRLDRLDMSSGREVVRVFVIYMSLDYGFKSYTKLFCNYDSIINNILPRLIWKQSKRLEVEGWKGFLRKETKVKKLMKYSPQLNAATQPDSK